MNHSTFLIEMCTPKGIFTKFFFSLLISTTFDWIYFIDSMKTVKENSIWPFHSFVENDIDQDTWFDENSLLRRSTLCIDWNNVLLYQYLTFFYHRYFDFHLGYHSVYLFLNIVSFIFSLSLSWTIGISSFIDKYGWLTTGNSSVLKCIFFRIQWSNKLNDREEEENNVELATMIF